MERETNLKTEDLGTTQGYVVTRDQALQSDGASTIRWKVETGLWVRRQGGVYQVDRRPQTWLEKVWAAVLAGGPGSLASHRTALLVWGFDGLSTAPVEVTVPYSNRPVPTGVIVHRTRRVQDEDEVTGLPVTSVPRTLLDCAGCLPEIVVTKAVDSAIRQRLTSFTELQHFANLRGGRGVRGTKRLRHVATDYESDSVPGSPAESEAFFHIRNSSLPWPVLQQEFLTRNGRRVPDFFWPEFNKAAEVDGLGTHSSADALDDDLSRQNDLLELGIELRRFSARQVRRDPTRFIDDLRRYLDAPG